MTHECPWIFLGFWFLGWNELGLWSKSELKKTHFLSIDRVRMPRSPADLVFEQHHFIVNAGERWRASREEWRGFAWFPLVPHPRWRRFQQMKALACPQSTWHRRLNDTNISQRSLAFLKNDVICSEWASGKLLLRDHAVCWFSSVFFSHWTASVRPK